jgi:hypothetical protein
LTDLSPVEQEPIVAGACTRLVSDSVVSTMARSARTGSSEDQGKREASPAQENTPSKAVAYSYRPVHWRGRDR